MERPERGEWRYEALLVAVCCAAYGVVNFEMFAGGYLMPFIQPALKLSNAQVGMLAAAYWVTFAVSSYLGGELADRLGGHRRMLVATLIAFAVGSVFSGFAASFAGLLICRIAMGAIEGPVPQLVQSLVALATPAQRRGTNAGIAQTLGAGLFGSLLAPIVVVQVAVAFGWRAGFFVVILPGLLCATLIARVVREPAILPAGHGSDGASRGLRGIFAVRNVRISIAAGCLAVACLTIGGGFLPLFLARSLHLGVQRMGLLMSVLGASTIVLGTLLPALSDRIGRRPVVIGANLMGAPCLAFVALHPPGAGAIAAILFLAWAAPASATLFFVTIPAESVAPAFISRAIGLVIGLSTLIGGVLGPGLAGLIADRWGLQAPLLLAAGCLATIGLLSLALIESATVSRTRDPVDQRAGVGAAQRPFSA